MNLFVYGTLLDDELRRAVIGRGRVQLMPARLQRHRRVHLAGTPYPTLRPDSESAVDGVLLTRIGGQAVARLSAYEGPAYRLRRSYVETGAGTVSTHVYTAALSRASREDWSFTRWREDSTRRDIRPGALAYRIARAAIRIAPDGVTRAHSRPSACS